MKTTAKKRSSTKRRRRRRHPSVVMLVVLAALVAGFVTRRLMLPSAVHYLAHRPPDHPTPAAQIELSHDNVDREDAVAARGPASPDAASSPASTEHLTSRDKKQIDDILQSKTR